MKVISSAAMEKSPSFFKNLINEGAIVLDVRTRYEYAGYHPDISINIPYEELERFREYLLRYEKPFILFSTYGRRSEMAARKMRSWGLEVFDAGTISFMAAILDY